MISSLYSRFVAIFRIELDKIDNTRPPVCSISWIWIVLLFINQTWCVELLLYISIFLFILYIRKALNYTL